jgi:cation diffusion facilitator CzcD-associated flavoprotein CzcO
VSVSSGYDEAFPTLTAADLELVLAHGTRRAVNAGDYLFRQGDQRDDLVQAEKFGAFLSSPCAAAALREENGHLVVRLSDDTNVVGRAVIAATGATYRRLDVDRLDCFEGNGVYYAATELESRLCGGSPVVVVGGGNSAGQAAMFLAESATSVALLIRGSDLGKNMSRYLVDRVEAHPRIKVHLNSHVGGLVGEAGLESIRVTGPDGESVMPCFGLFSLIGAEVALTAVSMRSATAAGCDTAAEWEVSISSTVRAPALSHEMLSLGVDHQVTRADHGPRRQGLPGGNWCTLGEDIRERSLRDCRHLGDFA